MLIWLLVGAVVVIGGVRVGQREPADQFIPKGTELDGDITLITSDRQDVACASDRTVGGAHCAFKADGSPWPGAGDERETLQPFMTVDRHLYLFTGLFLEPEVGRRYASEPPHGPREKLRRFTARCKLKVTGNLTDFRLHWVVGSPWSPPQRAEIATVGNCRIDG